MSSSYVEEILNLSEKLSRQEKFELVERILEELKDIDKETKKPQPRRSLLGLAADLGPAPSAEDIDEARREMWGNFPREDI
ncbi:MAG: hypothetical protein ABI690_24790 [Chloroflexota bacterium]